MSTRAGVQWVTLPPPVRGSNRYTLHDPWNPTLAWMTGTLSWTHDNVLRYMEDSHRMAKQQVQNLSRVDTGLMRMMADSNLHIRGDVFELNFGWEVDAPHYATYQEFGTQYIEPMLAVGTVFEEIWSGLPNAVVGR